jgi:lysophospholipase L1-like esterase
VYVTGGSQGAGTAYHDYATVKYVQSNVPPPPPPVGPLTYVATGDSIAAGADLPQPDEQRYPALLCTEFKKFTETSCDNISHSDDDTEDYIHRQLDKAIKAKPDIITVTVGADEIIKDPLRWRRIFTSCDVESARINLKYILSTLLYGTDALVVVTGYYNPINPSNNSEPLQLWGNMEACVLEGNNAIYEIVVSLTSTWPDRILWAPLYDSFKGHEFGTSESWIAPCKETGCSWVGGVHPNQLGQAAIERAVITAMAK